MLKRTRTAAGARAEIAERLDALAARLIAQHAAELAALARPAGRGVALITAGIDGRPSSLHFVPVGSLAELPRPFRRLAREAAWGARRVFGEFAVVTLLAAPALPAGLHFHRTWLGGPIAHRR